MSNSILVLELYRNAGTWCFTDAERDLVHEPFISGIPEIIDECIAETVENKAETYRLTFSNQQFPGATNYLTYLFEEYGGAVYTKQKIGQEANPMARTGWLCPATLKFFEFFPKTIYFALHPLGCASPHKTSESLQMNSTLQTQEFKFASTASAERPDEISNEYGINPDYFGGEDLKVARAQGFTDEEIKTHLDNNPELLRKQNVPGGGGLYDELVASLNS
jgi:hypothetical protein